MANLSKEKRERMIAYLETLKENNRDDASITALNEIENELVKRNMVLFGKSTLQKLMNY